MVVRIEKYRKLEAAAYSQEYRQLAVDKYNQENDTQYRNAYELIHKLTEADKPCTKIAAILGISKSCVREDINS